MDHYIWSQRSCFSCSPLLRERLKLLIKLIYGNKLVKYKLHYWVIDKSTFESFRTSFPVPSKISQLACLFTISNYKLPV